MWVFNSQTESMESREVSFVPGLYKIFDEIMVNAADNKQRDKNMDEIRVEVDRDNGFVSVQNNGRGIPVEKHEASHSQDVDSICSLTTIAERRNLHSRDDLWSSFDIIQLRR